ncbi:hypothetical protein V6N00_13505 [Tersicoccus sp. MR15.9]|uniref:hypothetical protein n=1 Tax=Tersicoccus mangrovi TaxID=3121635 RepID=UPI002FE56302
MSTTAQPRHPAGRREGGRWAPPEFADALVSLSPASRTRQTMAERAELFTAAGYVPATAVPAVQSPYGRDRIEQWWGQEFATAEYRADGTAFPQMPDDYTPSRHYGNALSGHRRTHRMRYGNGEVQLRMPSVTSIKRYSAENGNPTFDVPISVALHGGEAKQGWVRVTRTGPDQWATTVLGGGDDATSARIGEAVASVLESRRPSRALVGVEDLLEKARLRKAQVGTELNAVTSHFIAAVGYDRASGIMATQIKDAKYGDRTYGHRVPEEVYQQVKDADRPGTLFNQLVRGAPRAQVTRCEKCGRFSAVAVGHACASHHKDASGIGAEHTAAAKAAGAAWSHALGGTTRPPQPQPQPEVKPERPAVPVEEVSARVARLKQAAVTGTGQPVPPARLGKMELQAARRRMGVLMALKPGTDVWVDGKLMQIQAFEPERLDHPDNRAVLKVGYGPGRYNSTVTVNALREGYVDVQPVTPAPAPAPEPANPDAPARPRPVPAHLHNPINSLPAYRAEWAPLAAGARAAGGELVSDRRGSVRASVKGDSWQAAVEVDRDGNLHRLFNGRPVETFSSSTPAAGAMADWANENALKLARIADADARRRP